MNSKLIIMLTYYYRHYYQSNMSIVVKVPNIFNSPWKLYGLGIVFGMFANGYYYCKKELNKQNKAEKLENYDMSEILGQTFIGVFQGVFVGLLWPIVGPVMLSNYFNKKNDTIESK